MPIPALMIRSGIVLSILSIGCLGFGEVTDPQTDTNAGSVAETCEPPSQDSAGYRCAVGLFNGVRAILYDLPAGFLSTLAAGSQALADCNRDREIKRGILLIVEPMIRDEMNNYLSLGCESLLQSAPLLERQFYSQIREKQRMAEQAQEMLSLPNVSQESRTRLETRMKDFELSSSEQEFLARMYARNEIKSQISQQQMNNIRDGVTHMWNCADVKDVVEGACNLVGGAGAAGAVMRTARVAGVLASAEGGGAGVVISATLRSQLLRSGLNPTQIGRMTQTLTVEQITEVSSLMTLVRNGTALNLEQSARLGGLLNQANVRGFTAFHRTTPGAQQSIAEQSLMFGERINRRVYAFPILVNGPSVTMAGRNLGESMVTFQGQAATLFSDRSVRGLWSLTQRYRGHQATGVGNLIIDESQWVDDVLVVTRAHVEQIPMGQRIVGTTLDTTDRATTVGYGALGGYLAIEGIGRLNLLLGQ